MQNQQQTSVPITTTASYQVTRMTLACVPQLPTLPAPLAGQEMAARVFLLVEKVQKVERVFHPNPEMLQLKTEKHLCIIDVLI